LKKNSGVARHWSKYSFRTFIEDNSRFSGHERKVKRAGARLSNIT